MSQYVIEAPGGLVIPVLMEDPEDAPSGTIWYNSSDKVYKSVINGETAALADSEIFENDIILDAANKQLLLTYPVEFRASIFKYYLERDGQVQMGELHIATNGISLSMTDNNTYTDSVGLTFVSDVSSGNVRIRACLTSTGFNCNIKYSINKW